MSDIAGNPAQSEFVHADETTGGSKFEAFSNASVVMEHVRRILRLGSEEPHGGYWNEFPSNDNLLFATKVYVPDAAARFCMSIMSLCDYLAPHVETYEPKKAKKGAAIDWKQRVTTAYEAVKVLEESGGLNENSGNRTKTLWAYRTLFRELSGFLRSVEYFCPGGMDT